MFQLSNRKIFILILALSSSAVGNFVFTLNSFAATKPTVSIRITGKAKFVLQGTVTAITTDSLTFHITNTSKNAKSFDNKDKVIAVVKNTKITKNGHVIMLNKINKGDVVKVFGVFDKKSGAITLVRWIKVMPK